MLYRALNGVMLVLNEGVRLRMYTAATTISG